MLTYLMHTFIDVFESLEVYLYNRTILQTDLNLYVFLLGAL